MVTSESPFGSKIDARAVFEQDRAALINLLQDLRADEWQRPSACAPWLVRDVVAHLLGNDLSRLARTRDGHTTGNAPRSGEPLPAFLHRFNQDWVSAASRISPAVLVDLLETTSPQVLRMWRDLDRALPHTLAHREDAEGTVLTVEVSGPGGGTWSWRRTGHRWRWTDHSSAAATILTIDPDTLWRLCVRGIEPHHAAARVTVRGNTELADAALQIVSIIR